MERKQPPSECPYCGCEDIEWTTDDDFGDGEAWITTRCRAAGGGCGKEWREVYTYSHLEDMDGDPINTVAP